MASHIVLASPQLSSSHSSSESLGKYIEKVFRPPTEHHLAEPPSSSSEQSPPSEESSPSTSESSSASSESPTSLVVATHPSPPSTHICLPREGAVDYCIGNWATYFDDCRGDDHFETETSDLWYHRQLDCRDKNNSRCALFCRLIVNVYS